MFSNMGRTTQFNFLQTVFPPFTNRNVKLLIDKANAHIAQHLRRSQFYMIGARAQASFVNERVDLDRALIHVDVEVGNTVVDSGVIDVNKFEGLHRDPVIQITPEAVLIGGTKKGTHAKVWLTPDSVYWHKARGCRYLDGFSKHEAVCKYDLLYVGIAKEQDSYQRLIKNAHLARMRVLSEEPVRKPGAHPSDEIILFLFDLEPLSIQQIGPEDGDDFDLFYGADRKRVIADAEKAFVKMLDPDYNVTKFKNYPKGDDGLYGEGLTNYAYVLNENMRFMTAKNAFKGALSESGLDNRQDCIMVEGDEVQLHIGEVAGDQGHS